jgi:hypothetical protein
VEASLLLTDRKDGRLVSAYLVKVEAGYGGNTRIVEAPFLAAVDGLLVRSYEEALRHCGMGWSVHLDHGAAYHAWRARTGSFKYGSVKWPSIT